MHPLPSQIIHHRALTAPELKTYFEVYVKMFQADGKAFPKAMTMLDATAEASNRNALDLSFKLYKTAMDKVMKAGASGGRGMFMKEATLRGHHDAAEAAAFAEFEAIATLGSDASIAAARATLQEQVEAERVRCFEVNEMRNPFRDLEMYAVPVLVAVAGWLVATVVDVSCSHAVCEFTQSSFEKLVRPLCILPGTLFLSLSSALCGCAVSLLRVRHPRAGAALPVHRHHHVHRAAVRGRCVVVCRHHPRRVLPHIHLQKDRIRAEKGLSVHHLQHHRARVQEFQRFIIASEGTVAHDGRVDPNVVVNSSNSNVVVVLG
jgi:hypothetical protein